LQSARLAISIRHFGSKDDRIFESLRSR